MKVDLESYKGRSELCCVGPGNKLQKQKRGPWNLGEKMHLWGRRGGRQRHGCKPGGRGEHLIWFILNTRGPVHSIGALRDMEVPHPGLHPMAVQEPSGDVPLRGSTAF